jgi:hypothetical protein
MAENVGRSEIKRALINPALRIALAATALGGGAYAAYETIPAVHQPVDQHFSERFGLIEPEVSPIFDPNAKVNIVKTGVNAIPATPEQIKEFIDRTPPTYETPKAGGSAPGIQMLIPINPETAKNFKIIQDSVDTKGRNEPSYYYFDQSNLYIEKGAQVALPLIAGAKTAELKAIAYSNQSIRIIEAIYTLEDGRKIKGTLSLWGTNYNYGDILNSVPKFDPNIVKSLAERDAIQGEKFNLSENPHIPLLAASGPARITLTYSEEDLALSPTFAIDNGKALYTLPSK